MVQQKDGVSDRVDMNMIYCEIKWLTEVTMNIFKEKEIIRCYFLWFF